MVNVRHQHCLRHVEMPLSEISMLFFTTGIRENAPYISDFTYVYYAKNVFPCTLYTSSSTRHTPQSVCNKQVKQDKSLCNRWDVQTIALIRQHGRLAWPYSSVCFDKSYICSQCLVKWPVWRFKPCPTQFLSPSATCCMACYRATCSKSGGLARMESVHPDVEHTNEKAINVNIICHWSQCCN